jgi:hypothetical protein
VLNSTQTYTLRVLAVSRTSKNSGFRGCSELRFPLEWAGSEPYEDRAGRRCCPSRDRRLGLRSGYTCPGYLDKEGLSACIRSSTQGRSAHEVSNLAGGSDGEGVPALYRPAWNRARRQAPAYRWGDVYAVRRRLGVAARSSGKSLEIKQVEDEVYFWVPLDRGSRRKRGRRLNTAHTNSP